MKTNSYASSCSTFVPYQNNTGGMGNAGNHVSSTHMPNNTYNTYNTYNSFYNTNQNIY